MKFHRNKIQLKQMQVKYLSHVVSGDRLKPDLDKIEAVERQPNSMDVQSI